MIWYLLFNLKGHPYWWASHSRVIFSVKNLGILFSWSRRRECGSCFICFSTSRLRYLRTCQPNGNFAIGNEHHSILRGLKFLHNCVSIVFYFSIIELIFYLVQLPYLHLLDNVKHFSKNWDLSDIPCIY